MQGMIPEPFAGQSILDWARPVTRRLNAMGGKAGATARNDRDRRGSSATPLPYAVRFNQALNNNQGGWMIYLPSGDLLCFRGEYLTLDGVVARENADGWFTFVNIDLNASAIYLNVEVEVGGESDSGEETISAEAVFAASASNQSGDQELSRSLKIAEVSYTPAEAGTPAQVVIRQCVAGAIMLDPSKEQEETVVPPVDDVSVELYKEPPPETPGSGEEEKTEETEEKYSVKGWHNQAAVSQELADMLGGDSSPQAFEVMARDASPEGGRAVKYIPLGNGLMKHRQESVEITTVSAVEYGEYEVDGETDWRIRITKHKITFATDGGITVGDAEYSFIGTVAHTSEMDGGGTDNGGAS